MAKYVTGRNSFLYGDVSPRVHGRNDIEQYKQMCELIENFVVNPQGGARRRGGSVFRSNIVTLGTVKIIPFLASDGASHLILLSSTKIRIYALSGGGLSTPTSWESGIAYGTDWGFTDASGFGLGDDLQYAQFGDLMVITASSHEPMVITREFDGTFKYFRYTRGQLIKNGAGTSTFNTAKLAYQLPWAAENLSATTITATGTLTTGGSVTLTASVASFSSAMAEYSHSMGGGVNYVRLGSYFRIRSGTTYGVVRVTGYSSSTVVTGVVVSEDTVPSGAQTAWSESSWSDRSGFPRCCTFYQERLYMAGTLGSPDGVWASEQGDMYQFTSYGSYTIGDNNAFFIYLNFGEIGLINFMSPGVDLVFGTSTREAILDELDERYGIALDNVKVVPHTQDGGYNTQPIRHNNTLVFADKTGARLKEFIFSFQDQAYKTSNLSFFSSHLIKAGRTITEIAYQASEDIIWVLTDRSELYAVTRNKEFDVLAWHRHQIGGLGMAAGYGYGTTLPYINSIASIVDPSTGRDVLFLAVTRSNDGVDPDFYHLEAIYPQDVTDEDTLEELDYPFLDNHVVGADGTYSAPNTTWTALAPNLASCEVSVIINGNYMGEYTLNASGTLVVAGDYSDPETVVQVGYNYQSTLIPLALESNSLFGNGLGSVKRTDEITVLFEATVGAKFGTKTKYEADGVDGLEEIQFRASTVPSGDSTPIYTGEQTVKFPADYERKQQVVIVQDKPYPCTVSAIISKGVLYD